MVGPTPANNNMRPPSQQQQHQQQQQQQQTGFMNFPNNNNNNHSFIPPPINNNNNNNQFLNPFQQQQQQQHSQMFSPNPMMMMMNPALFNPHQNNVAVGNQQQQQLLLQNTIQNISQLLQLQNQNQFRGNGQQIPQQPQFGVMQHPTAAATNPFFQNQIMPQGMGGPQNQNMYMNPMFGMMANANRPMMQNLNNNGQPRFVSPPSTQIVQTQNSAPTITNIQDNNGTNSQHKNFTGHKTNDASNKRFKPHKHGKEKFGIHNGNMSRAKANNSSSANFGPGNSTKFEMKLPSLKYTEHEIKQWREARKKHYPKSITVEKEKKEQTLSDVADQADTLRRQQLKEILAKQAELGLEVADIPSSYLSSPSRAHAHAPDKQNHREKKFERERYKKGKFQKRRGKRFQDDRNGKRTRQTHEHKPDEREPSLLQKLLTRDIKRDKNHLLQVFRFIAANSFFNEETDNSLRFPSVIVRETKTQETETETACSVSKGNDDKAEDEEEGELTD